MYFSHILKYRPEWRPGAVSKALVRKYRQVRGQIDIQAKKRKAMLKRAKTKRDAKKPALIVKKVDGEYSVQMEVIKIYSNERFPFQYPYEDKPPLIYSVGRTAEENAKRQKKKERFERREMHYKNKFIQSTFRNMCEDICMKAYKQAIGLSPNPDPNDPSCPCFPDKPDRISLTADSCSCDDSSSDGSSTETDGDDWEIKFTPPTARYNPEAKHPPHAVQDETQYNYLDFRVKLVDQNGIPVPRFFTGPDGKQVCSDLGGFWGPGHVWLEIGKDGFVGIDGRWVPMTFIGPDGTVVSAEDGYITDASGRKFKIGVDGYVDKDGKWAFYPPGPKPPYKFPSPPGKNIGMSKISDASIWTCLPMITPSKVDFVPHGKDRAKLKQRLDDRVRETGSTDFKMPKGKVVPRFRGGKQVEIDQTSNRRSGKGSSVTFKAGKPGGKLDKKRSANKKGAGAGGVGSGKSSATKTATRDVTSKPSVGKQSAGLSAGPKASRGKDASPSRTGTKRSTNVAKTAGRSIGDIIQSGGMNAGTSALSENRAAAMKMIMDPRTDMSKKKVCKLTRMIADGRHISGHHKDCYGESVGDCCVEQEGICTEIFKIAHQN